MGKGLNDLAKDHHELVSVMGTGLRAYTTQPYTEVNSKFGTQYEAAFFISALAALGTSDLVITTGANSVAIKDIQVRFNSTRISQTLFKNPTFTGGITIPIFNLNDAGAVSGAMTVVGGNVVTTVTGTQVSPTTNSLGSVGQGNSILSEVTQAVGVERILDKNSQYLLRFINEDASNVTDIAGISTWYEGPLDYPLAT